MHRQNPAVRQPRHGVIIAHLIGGDAGDPAGGRVEEAGRIEPGVALPERVQQPAIRALFTINATSGGDSYDVFPDGKNFLTNTINTEETPAPLSLVLNWTAELKK